MKLELGVKIGKLKGKLSKPIFWIWIIFILVLAIRLYIAFQTPLFNYDAYSNLRQIESIKNTGTPLYNDPLSYGGKTQLFAPLNYYIIAAFGFLMPIEIAGKIVPNLMAAMLVFLTYYLALKITKSTKISTITAIISGFIPVYFIDINRISVDYFAVLLIFAIVYCMLKLTERKYVDYALILMFLLVLVTPMAFVLVLGLLLYLVFLKLENFEVEMKELEIILFFTFLVFWVNLLIYKNAFLTHGLLVIWQNIPIQILSNFFSNIGFIELLWAISIIPILLGVYACYAIFHKERSKELLIVVSIGISTFLLLWFKLLDVISGLIYLSIALVILSAYSLKKFNEFIIKSKIHKYEKILNIIIVALFLITAIPSIIYITNHSNIGPSNTPSRGEISTLIWASKNTPKDTVITSRLEEGNIVAYYGKRKNVMDTNFLLTPRIDQRLNDINDVYTTTFETRAIGILNKYNSGYILITPNTMQEYNLSEITYLKDVKCFRPEYQNESTILYRVDCKIG